MKLNLIKNKKGFTIIETLVAVAILMISIAGPLTIAHKGLMASIYARDNVIASYLAQDAMEYIKNVRDNNMLSDRNWLYGLDGCTQVSDDTHCSVDTVDGNPLVATGITPCGGSSCQLFLDSEGYRFVTNGKATQFQRFFYIVPNATSPSTEATLFVKVNWKNGTIDNSLVYRTEIFKVTL